LNFGQIVNMIFIVLLTEQIFMLPINKPRTKAILKIGPQNKKNLDLIICGMLSNFWVSIPGTF